MSAKSNSGRLFFLDLGAGRILSVNPDGSDLKTVLTEGQGPHPDGVVVDAARGHIYWTNMGNFTARRLDRALRSRRQEPQVRRSAGRHAYPEAAPDRKGNPKALLVRP